ncbi:MAG: hypothetical protein ACKO8U_02190 [Pirellula sp.]
MARSIRTWIVANHDARCLNSFDRVAFAVVAGRAIHRLDQFWATGNIALHPTGLRIEAR